MTATGMVVRARRAFPEVRVDWNPSLDWAVSAMNVAKGRNTPTGADAPPADPAHADLMHAALKREKLIARAVLVKL